MNGKAYETIRGGVYRLGMRQLGKHPPHDLAHYRQGMYRTAGLSNKVEYVPPLPSYGTAKEN